ncbi:glycine receptor subunit alpha-2-like isoform X2 [Mercenaria mercenaria]|uniref:glycine receptor subunit alpha-2-like isoform X2 n=1 Tax=Mercenaria mercenaria TaxID=6596 RepID=UPI00234E5AB5|nr:glycine receptor subunit alpha-2-like isoform X2 [Mercenaria mercenaria]
MDKYSIFVYIFIFGYCRSREMFEQDRIRRDITAYLLNENRYDATIVPELDEDFPTNVTVQILIRNMHSINEVAMEYSVGIYLRMWWRDTRLDYREITNTTYLQKLELDTRQIDKVWQPNIYFDNEKQAFVHKVTTTNRLMHIYRDGTVVYSIRLSLTMSCTMSLHYYPFDAQTCPLVIQSFCYTTDNIRLQWHGTNPVKISKLQMPQYALLEDETETSSYDLEYEESTFSTLEVELSLSRKIGYYVLQVFTPCIFLVVLSWVSFWVDPDAVPARVSLGVLCVLTMTTQSAVVHQSLPPVSYVKAIDVWMFVCLFFVFASLLEFACVNVILQKKVDSEEKKTFEASTKTQREKALEVDRISMYLFPSTFIVFAFIFFMVSGLA